MHEQANALSTRIIGWTAAVAIAGLNIVLIVGVISGA